MSEHEDNPESTPSFFVIAIIVISVVALVAGGFFTLRYYGFLVEKPETPEQVAARQQEEEKNRQDQAWLDAQKQKRKNQMLADNQIAKIVYMKDPRTGTCFAYFWDGAYDGGPALATIPCERIPPNMLNIAFRPLE